MYHSLWPPIKLRPHWVVKEHRYIIASKISQGVSFQRILDDIREGTGKVKRLRLTTCQDIRNIVTLRLIRLATFTIYVCALVSSRWLL